MIPTTNIRVSASNSQANAQHVGQDTSSRVPINEMNQNGHFFGTKNNFNERIEVASQQPQPKN